MFDKNKFSNILKKVLEQYNNQNEFAHKSNIGRAYISRILNMRLDTPPKPSTLEGIANASKGITTYSELMQVCGYTNYMIDSFFDDAIHQKNNKIPIVYDIKFSIEQNKFIAISDSNFILANFVMEKDKEYFAYKVNDESMLPLLGIGDLAIIEKNDTFKNGNTCLIYLDNKIIIRKIVDFIDYIELQTVISFGQNIKLTKEEMQNKNFTILGRVIRIENDSAFK